MAVAPINVTQQISDAATAIGNNAQVQSIVNTASGYTKNLPTSSPLPKLIGIPTLSGFIDNLVNKWILIPPTNNNDDIVGSSLVFSFVDSYSIDGKANISEHITEDLNYIQNSLSIEPKRINLHGYIGELSHTPSATIEALQSLNAKLLIVDAYLPNFTKSANAKIVELATEALQAVSYIDAAVSAGVGLYNIIAANNPTPQLTKLQQSYDYLKQLLEGVQNKRKLLSCLTPFAYFENLLIENFSIKTSSDSTYIAEISISLKEIRVAATKTVPYQPSKMQSANQARFSPTVDHGKTNGIDEGLVNRSALSNITGLQYTASSQPVGINSTINQWTQVQGQGYSPIPSGGYGQLLNNL